MRGICILTSNALKRLFRNKGVLTFIILSLTVPIIFLTFNYTDQSRLAIGILDNDHSALSKDMINTLTDSGHVNIEYVDKSEINTKVASGDIDCALIIPPNFEEGIIRGNVQRPQILSLKGQEVTSWLKSTTNTFIANACDIAAASNNDPMVFKKMYQSYLNSGSKMDVVVLKDASAKNIASQRSLGFFIMFLMMSANSVAGIMLNDRRNRTFHRICLAPVKISAYMVSYFLINTVVMLFQVSVIIALVINLLKFPLDSTAIGLWIITAVFGVMAVTLGMMINAFSNSSLQASSISILITMPTCMLGGVFWPLNIMPSWLARLSNLIPQKWVIEATTKLQSGQPLGSIAMNITVLLAFACIFLALTIYKTKISDKSEGFV